MKDSGERRLKKKEELQGLMLVNDGAINEKWTVPTCI